MTAEARRLLHALLERTGARMDEIERRFDALERVVFEIDALEARIARLEQCPPTPLGGRELQRHKHQLAEHYACSIRSIQLALAAGMPSKKIFGKVKFRLSLVEPWLEAHGYLVHHGSDRSSTVIAHSIERADGAYNTTGPDTRS